MVSCFSMRYNFVQGLCPGNGVATSIITIHFAKKELWNFFFLIERERMEEKKVTLSRAGQTRHPIFLK